MNTETKLSAEEQQVIEHVRDIKAFYSHATSYALIVGALFILNFFVSPDNLWAKKLFTILLLLHIRPMRQKYPSDISREQLSLFFRSLKACTQLELV